MNLEERQQLEKDCQRAGVRLSEGVPRMLLQFWAFGFHVPPFFMWPVPVLVLYYVFYMNVTFVFIWLTIRSGLSFFQAPASLILPVFCTAFSLGAIIIALMQLRVRKKIFAVTDRYSKQLSS